MSNYIIEGIKRAAAINPIKEFAEYIAHTEIITEHDLREKCRKAGIPDPVSISFINYWRDERFRMNRHERQ